MRKYLLLFLFVSAFTSTYACTTCDRRIQKAIFDSTFYPNLFTMLLAFIVLGIIVMLLSFISGKKHKEYITRYPHQRVLSPVPLVSAATVLGIGLGGFVDGIFLHQILQWHEMLSNKIAPVDYVTKSVNMFWDGIFHAFTLLVVCCGIVLMWRLLFRKDINRSGKLMTGGILLGWSLFNLVEGIIDHHILKLHNVREVTANKDLWNYGFLGISVVILIIGLFLTNQKTIISAAAIQ